MPRRNGRTSTSDRRAAAADGRQLKAEGKVDKIDAKASLALAKSHLALAKAQKRKWLVLLIAVGIGAYLILKGGMPSIDFSGLLEKAKGLLPGGD